MHWAKKSLCLLHLSHCSLLILGIYHDQRLVDAYFLRKKRQAGVRSRDGLLATFWIAIDILGYHFVVVLWLQ